MIFIQATVKTPVFEQSASLVEAAGPVCEWTPLSGSSPAAAEPSGQTPCGQTGKQAQCPTFGAR